MNEARFFCDEMLQRLGRWLRAAGYDTAIARPGEEDRALVAQANMEQRLLLTRDRHLARFRNGQGRVLLLQSNSLTAEVAELSARLAIDWLRRPLSRCLECNTRLIPATAAQQQQLPEGALRLSPAAWYCPHCDKLYWEGSHVRRMRHTLDNFAHGHWVVATD